MKKELSELTKCRLSFFFSTLLFLVFFIVSCVMLNALLSGEILSLLVLWSSVPFCIILDVSMIADFRALQLLKCELREKNSAK